MTDELSSLLGSVLTKVMVFGAVVVAMKMVSLGEFVLATGLVSPLILVGYLVATDGALLA